MLLNSRSWLFTPAKAGVHLSAVLLAGHVPRRRSLALEAVACGTVDPGRRRDDGSESGTGA
jgi:hypothetical protein